MIEEITIENFKSFKAVTLKLQHVNLLIGPNNSGKSNFLKGFVFWNTVMRNHAYNLDPFIEQQIVLYNSEELKGLHFGKDFRSPIKQKILLKKSINSLDYEIGLSEEGKVSYHVNDNREKADDVSDTYYGLTSTQKKVEWIFSSALVFQANPLTYTKPKAISRTTSIAADCSNLISFLETLRDEYRENFYAIEQDLRKCIPEFKDIRFQTVTSPSDDKRTYKRWGLFSENSDIIHWADELSEGVLYFVALLCIVHQPEPPKLLLLEEPERGIHPRRIKEVMDFIFQLAEEKNVQIIMTSHNEHVLNEFAETPESVFIFDKDEEGATQVKNLLTDVIEPSNEHSKEHELDKIDFTSNIGESWFEGLMGGVPV